MTPTPPPHRSLPGNPRFHSRRQRQIDAQRLISNATPSQAHALPHVTPLVDDDDAEGEGATDELSDVEAEDEDVEEDVDRDIEEDANDAEEEEGGIEEGLSRNFFYSLCIYGTSRRLACVPRTPS
jgi:hypothetical protein